MPSRTAVYGVGAATGLAIGLAIASRLGALPGRERLRHLLGVRVERPAAPTHIVLPDPVPAVAEEHGTADPAPDGVGAAWPVAPA
jgi:hypothetical protein